MPITKRNSKSFRSGTRRSTGTRGNKSSGTTRRTGTTASFSPTKFNSFRKEITAKIGSFRNVNQQISGAGKVTAFSPTTANKWIKFINSGTYVYKFNSAQMGRIVGQPASSTVTPTAAFRTLKSKFGAGIKGVTRGKGNNWLVAATNRITSRPFSNYTWK